jgi:ribose-phosphate pyrophosphokinase
MTSPIQAREITATILPSESVKAAHTIRILQIAPLLGEAIARTAEEQSVSSLFY